MLKLNKETLRRLSDADTIKVFGGTDIVGRPKNPPTQATCTTNKVYDDFTNPIQ